MIIDKKNQKIQKVDKLCTFKWDMSVFKIDYSILCKIKIKNCHYHRTVFNTKFQIPTKSLEGEP